MFSICVQKRTLLFDYVSEVKSLHAFYGMQKKTENCVKYHKQYNHYTVQK